MGGGPSYYYPSSTQQTTAGPWKAQAPYLKGQSIFDATQFGVPEKAGVFPRAQDIGNRPLPYYGANYMLSPNPSGLSSTVQPEPNQYITNPLTGANPFLNTQGLTYEPSTGKYYSGDYYVMPGGWQQQTQYLTDAEGNYKTYSSEDTLPEGKNIGDIKTTTDYTYVGNQYPIAPRFTPNTGLAQLTQAPNVGGLGSDYMNPFSGGQQASVPTLAAFTPEQLLAQQNVYNRATRGSAYLPLYRPQSAISDIILGNNQIDQYTALAPNIGTPAQLPTPYIQDIGNMTPAMVNQWGTPQGQGVGYTDLGFRNWDELQKVIGGDYLSPTSNPYLASMVEYAQRPLTQNYQNTILPTLDTTAIEAGRYGGGAWADLRSQESQNYERALGDIANQMYGGAYESERQRMQAGLGLSGQLSEAQAQIEAQRQAQIGSQAQQASMLGAGQAQERAMQNALFGQQAGTLGYQTDAERATQEALLRQQQGEFNIGFDQRRAIDLANMQNTINMFNAQQRTGADTQNIANIMQSATYAPELIEADYADYAKLAALGEEYQAFNQKMLEEDISRIDWASMEPWQREGMLSQLLGGQWGSNVMQQATQQVQEVGGGK